MDYVFGLACNERLRRRIRKALRRAKVQAKRSGRPARIFTEFRYRTRKSGSRARALYEDLYCAGGELETRIKEQMSLFAAAPPVSSSPLEFTGQMEHVLR